MAGTNRKAIVNHEHGILIRIEYTGRVGLKTMAVTTPRPGDWRKVMIICFAIAIILPVVPLAIAEMHSPQVDVAYSKPLFLQPLFVGIVLICACIVALIAFSLVWLLRLRLPLLSWIIDGGLLAAFFIVSSRAMAFDLYFHDIYVV